MLSDSPFRSTLFRLFYLVVRQPNISYHRPDALTNIHTFLNKLAEFHNIITQCDERHCTYVAQVMKCQNLLGSVTLFALKYALSTAGLLFIRGGSSTNELQTSLEEPVN